MTPDPLQYQHGLPLPPQCSQWLLIPFQIRKIFQIALGQTLRTSQTEGSDNQTVLQEGETPHRDSHNSQRGCLGGASKREEQEGCTAGELQCLVGGTKEEGERSWRKQYKDPINSKTDFKAA